MTCSSLFPSILLVRYYLNRSHEVTRGQIRSNEVVIGQVGSTYAEAAAVAPTIAGMSFISLDFLKIFRRKLEENDTVPSLYLDGNTNRNKSFGRFSIGGLLEEFERHYS